MDTVQLDTAPPARPGGGLPTILPDGTRILLRPIMPGDKAKLHRGMQSLSPLARRHRFFSALEDLDDHLVTYLTEIDYHSHFAWVAVALDLPGQPIIGVGRYIRLAEDPTTAEIAFVVGDDYQRLGLASALLDLLATVARANGVAHFFARLMTDNTPMRHILANAGATLENDDAGILGAILDLPPPSNRFDRDTVLSVAAAAAEMRRAA